MQPLKAHVRNGRLLLDEPTELPEGDVVELVSVDDVRMVEALDQAPLLTREEEDGLRAALSSLRAGNGRTVAQVHDTVDAILRR